MSYRGVLEVIEDLVEAKTQVEALTAELEQRVGMPADRFMAGARALVEPEPEGRELLAFRSQYGGGL